MFLSRFVGIRIVSAAIAVIFFWTQGGFAQNISQVQTVRPQVQLDILQDVHCNSQTQKSIFNYLNDLYSQNKLSGILQEGASGKINRSMWTKLDSAKRAKIIQGLCRDGWMGGAEKFAIEHPEISYSGVELQALYDMHRDVYRDVITKRESAHENLRDLNALANRLQAKYYSSDLIRLEHEWQCLKDDGNRLYLFLKNNLKNIPESRWSEFSTDFRNLAEMVKTEKISKNISADNFSVELDKFHEILRLRLIASDESRRLAKVSDYLNSLNDLWNLELTPASYGKFLFLEQTVKLKSEIAYLLALDNQISKISFYAQDNRFAPKAYYEMAKRRDEAIYRNVRRAIKNKSGHFVLVAGGFHGQDLLERLKHDSISVSLIRPQFAEIDSNLQEKYARAMGNFPVRNDLKVYLYSLMTLIPEPVTIRLNATQLFEVASLADEENSSNVLSANAKSLGLEQIPLILSLITVPVLVGRLLLDKISFSISSKWSPETLFADESIRMTTKDELRIKTETGRELVVKGGKVLHENSEEELSDGVNYFTKEANLKILTAQNKEFPAIRISQESDGSLMIGKLLSIGQPQTYAVRFQDKAEEQDPDSDFKTEAYLSYPESFLGEKTFEEWRNDEVETAYIEIGKKLVLIVERGGKIALAKMKGEDYGSPEDLEMIQELDKADVSQGPVVITTETERVKPILLTNEETKNQSPLVIVKQGEALSVRLTESVKGWSATRLQEVRIGPLPLEKKLPWVIALGFSLLLPVGGYVLTPTKQKEKTKVEPTPSPANTVEPIPTLAPAAPVASSTPAPVTSPSVASVPSSSVAVTTSVTKTTENSTEVQKKLQLPYGFDAAPGQVTIPIVSIRSGIFSISPVTSNLAYAVIPSELTEKKVWYEEKIAGLKVKIKTEHDRWEAEKKHNQEQTPNVKLPETSLREWTYKREMERAQEDLIEIESRIQACSVPRSYFGGYETNFTTADGTIVDLGEKLGVAISKRLVQYEAQIPADLAVLVANGNVKIKVDGIETRVVSKFVDFETGGDNLKTVFVLRPSSDPVFSMNKVRIEISEISIEGQTKSVDSASVAITGLITSDPINVFRAPSKGLMTLKPLLNYQGSLIPSGTRVVQYETVQVAGKLLSVKEANAKLKRSQKELGLMGELKVELARVQTEIDKLAAPGKPDRNQEEADRKTITSSLQSLLEIAKVLENKKPDNEEGENPGKETKLEQQIAKMIRMNAEMRDMESKLQANGVIRSEFHKFMEFFSTESLKIDSGGTPDYPGISKKITDLLQLDISSIPSAEENNETRIRLENEKKRIETGLQVMLSPGERVTLDQAFDAQSQKLKAFISLLEEAINKSVIALSQDMRLVKPAKSFLLYAEEGQELFSLSSGSKVTFTISKDQASLFKTGDDAFVLIGSSVIKGRVIDVLPKGESNLTVAVAVPLVSGKGNIPVKVCSVRGKSLGEMDRRQFLKLAALVGAAVAAGCQITPERIEEIRRDASIGVPNSLTTPASEVNIREIILKLNEIGEVSKVTGQDPGFKPLIEYLPKRNNNIREAQYRESDAEDSGKLMSGGGITPQLGVSSDMNGAIGIKGGFVITIPDALGGGALYLVLGTNWLEEAVKMSISFVAETQNLIMGLGTYFSDLKNIALRAAISELQNFVVDAVTQVQHLYRTLYLLKVSEKNLEERLRILGEEKSYAEELKDRVYQQKVAEKTAKIEGDLIKVRNDIRIAMEALIGTKMLNLSPEVKINFDDFKDLKAEPIETFAAEGATENEILRRVALIDKRVGLAHDKFTAFSYLKLLNERKANIPDAIVYLFGGHGVSQTTDLSFGNDQNRINFVRNSLRESGLVLRFPELTTFVPRLISGNSDDIDSLKRQRVAIVDEVKGLVLEEVRKSKLDYDMKLAALVDAGRALTKAQRELADLKPAREREEAILADVFAKRLEIKELEFDLETKKSEFREAFNKFSGYFPDMAEWQRNKLNKAREEETIREEGKQHLDDMRDFVNSSISYKTRQFNSVDALIASVDGKSLGQELSSFLKNKNKFSNDVLARRIGFLSALFGGISNAQSRKMAWVKFQGGFEKRLEILSPNFQAQSSAEKLDKPVSIFIEESDLSNRPEFLTQFLNRSVHLDVFVKASDRADALVKLATLFPEGTLPKNLEVHHYNSVLPLHDAMSRQIKSANESNVVPVVIGDGAKFFKKLKQHSQIIRVSHQKEYPRELVMELGRRIGIANGVIGQIAGDERILIGYDSQREMFNLLPLEKLIDELFQQVVRDYQIQIAA